MMAGQRTIKALIDVTVLVLVVVLYVIDAGQGPILRDASPVASVMLVLVFLFDVWLWQLPFFRGWLVKRPSVAGTWRVTLQSN